MNIEFSAITTFCEFNNTRVISNAKFNYTRLFVPLVDPSAYQFGDLLVKKIQRSRDKYVSNPSSQLRMRSPMVSSIQ